MFEKVINELIVKEKNLCSKILNDKCVNLLIIEIEDIIREEKTRAMIHKPSGNKKNGKSFEKITANLRIEEAQVEN